MTESPKGEEPEVVSLVLATLFSGVQPDPWPDPHPLAVRTALEWQQVGTHAVFAELHGTTHGLPRGRLAELIGRIASTGEQLGLSWTCEQDMRRWLAPDAQERDSWAVPARALAEITGYYAISAGHGVANVTLRSLLVQPEAAAVINQDKDLKRAKGFDPFSTVPAAWVPLNEKVATVLLNAAAGRGAAQEMAELVVALTRDARWVALTNRRHVDFHRWRPQSVSGGVATSNPWESTDTGSYSLTMYGRSQHEPPNTSELIAEASDGLEALAECMERWLDVWPSAIRDLGVPLFKDEEA
ncbi:hypothetical protein [Blastococcus sp. TF02A-26]|uniref:hypothetical protein n=1 Tax=Blastococcus sp. TF02A-26 TaxID=2250577 RepID=UPI0011BE9CB0|nr:hypothetical protein [Blastococcus sp. TF02A-26]